VRARSLNVRTWPPARHRKMVRIRLALYPTIMAVGERGMVDERDHAHASKRAWALSASQRPARRAVSGQKGAVSAPAVVGIACPKTPAYRRCRLESVRVSSWDIFAERKGSAKTSLCLLRGRIEPRQNLAAASARPKKYSATWRSCSAAWRIPSSGVLAFSKRK
jgi:hypothetical protein